jgi:hypothetical protein
MKGFLNLTAYSSSPIWSLTISCLSLSLLVWHESIRLLLLNGVSRRCELRPTVPHYTCHLSWESVQQTTSTTNIAIDFKNREP